MSQSPSQDTPSSSSLSPSSFPARGHQSSIVEPVDPFERGELDGLEAAPQPASVDDLGYGGRGRHDLVGLPQLAVLALQRARSSLVRPGRAPASHSARRAQWRNVSALQPILAPIETIAAHCEAYLP